MATVGSETRTEREDMTISSAAKMELKRSQAEFATVPATAFGLQVRKSIFRPLRKKPLSQITGLDVPRGVDPDLLAIECNK
jgi:hypothetical protein